MRNLYLMLNIFFLSANISAGDLSGKADLDRIIKADKATDKMMSIGSRKKNQKVWIEEVRYSPDYLTSIEATYNFPGKGFPLYPGKAVYLAVPKSIQKKAIVFLVIGHRQKTRGNPRSIKERDTRPGLSSIQIFSKADKKWRFWSGQASGWYGAKFAEPRRSPEMEGLYEWYKYGHRAVFDYNDISRDLLNPQAIRIVSMGDEEIYLHSITLKVIPKKAKFYEKVIFSPNAIFGDPITAQGRKYGGGYGYRGTYPGALWLQKNRNKVSLSQLPKNLQTKFPRGWDFRNNVLIANPPAGNKLSTIEMMVGDLHPDGKRNTDGGIGTQGWARLSVYLKKPNGDKIPLLKRESVPPNGVLITGPHLENYVIKQGDQIHIESEYDTTYLMGVRMGYN